MSCMDYEIKSPQIEESDYAEFQPLELRSREHTGRRRSNSISMCALSRVPENFSFQELKGTSSLPGTAQSSPVFRGSSWKRSSSRNSSSTSTIQSLIQGSLQFQSIAGTAGDYLLSDSTESLQNKSLDECFNKSLMEPKLTRPSTTGKAERPD